jgi:hypothetical protein
VIELLVLHSPDHLPQVTHVHSMLVECPLQTLGVSWNCLNTLQILNQLLNCILFQKLSELFNKLLILFNFTCI